MDPERLKVLFAGVAASAALGLLLGDLMTPDFITLAEQQAAEPLPQIPGPHRAQVMAGEIAAEWTSLTGDIPDYVIGTDWTQPGALALAVESQDTPPPEAAPATEPVAAPTPAAVQALAHDQADLHAQPAYPSQGGGILAGIEPRPAAPPSAN